jgi:hypothetical protein
LPRAVQATARRAFKLFQNDPTHPGLRFKHIKGAVWSVRVGLGYRAFGYRTVVITVPPMSTSDVITWYWIGTHADYDQLIKTI